MSHHRRPTLPSLLSIASCLLSTLPAAALPVPERWRPEGPADPLWEKLAAGEYVSPLLEDGSADKDEFRHLEACAGGEAGGFPCERVDLYEQVSLSALGGSSGNDIWGWTDPVTGKEYALMGLNNGTVFVDLSDPENPVRVGNLPTHTSNSIWRDIKVHADHAFIVSEAPGHGLQIFDLTQLRDVVSPPATFSSTQHYGEFGSSHNIVINEDSGFAYAVGSDSCSGGLHMIDISDPTSPVNAGCFSDDGYTHDAQCVIYDGPDADHAGKEICMACNEDTLTVVDVTDKADPVQLSRTGYTGAGYTHQGWLTEDHAYFLLDDEGDEGAFGHNTRTYIWDVRDLDQPVLIDTHDAVTTNTDHNLYIVGDLVYQTNYGAGLRVLNLDDVAAGQLTEVAFFDTSSAWSNYPFFESGLVIVSDINQGLFVLKPQLCTDPDPPAGLTATPAGDNRIDLAWGAGPAGTTASVYRSFGTCPGGDFELVASGLTDTGFLDSVSGQVDHSYFVTFSDESGLCESAAGACASASTTGACTAPPIFAGLEQVTNQATAACALELQWPAASANCGPGVSYSVYRSTDPGFTPGPENRVAEGFSGTSWTDFDVIDGVTYAYVVRSTDLGSGTEDGNLVVVTGEPTGPLGAGTFMTGGEIGDPFLPSVTGSSGLKNHVGWELTDTLQHSGDRSFFSTYTDGMCSSLSTPPLELVPGEGSELRFWTAYFIELAWDGGVVQISDDGGATWQQLGVTPGYPGAFNDSSDACGFTSGTPSFTGDNLTWTEYTVDLSAYNGSEVEIRWTFSTDGGLSLDGWYIDDVSITNAAVPGACESIGNVIFVDGFETGDLAGWSGSSP